MRIYSVKGPDGRLYEVEGPDDASEEQIIAFVKEQIARAQEPAKAGTNGPSLGENSATLAVDQTDLKKASIDALTTTVGFGLVGVLLFWLIASRLRGKPRTTRNQLGLWCGAFLAALAVMVTGGKDFHLGWSELLTNLAVLVPMYFLLGYIVGFLFRSFRPITVKANVADRNSSSFILSNPEQSASIDNSHYEAAMNEIDESRMDRGLWARCFAESGGDDAKAKAAYIRIRAETLSRRV